MYYKKKTSKLKTNLKIFYIPLDSDRNKLKD